MTLIWEFLIPLQYFIKRANILNLKHPRAVADLNNIIVKFWQVS